MNLRGLASALGRRGGHARAARLSAERKAQIAALGGAARATSLELGRRIDDNFRYAEAASKLHGAPPHVVRRATHKGRLPGIYGSKA